MKLEDLAFPLTVEAFMAFQKDGRELHESWNELIEALVPEINAAYESNDPEELQDSLRRLDEGIAQFKNSPVICDMLKVTKNWLTYAHQKGKEAARPG